MARAVRKVSRASTKNQKKDSTLNKKLIAIVSAIVLVVAAVGISLGVYFGTQKEEEYVSDLVYFVEPTKGTNGDEEVIFTKDNYYNIKRLINNEVIAVHTFIFAYDGSAFYADPEADDYDENYTKLIKSVADLQKAVNSAKENDISVELYIIDLSVDNGINSALMSDVASDTSGGPYEPAFFYLYEGEFKAELETADSETKKVVQTTSMEYILNTSIAYSVDYLANLK